MAERSIRPVKLLVVGGSSFIAKNFLEQNDFGEIDVAATFHNDRDFPQFISRLGKNIKTIKYDLLNNQADFTDYDTCLYFAGNANHVWSKEHQLEDLSLNTTGLLNFLKGFRGRLIYMSSGAVYDGSKGRVSPKSKVEPTFPYAISKLASELYIKAAYEQRRLNAYNIIRFYYAYGPYEPPRRLIPRLFTTFIDERKREFTVNGDGTTLMQPMHVHDAAKAIYKVFLSDRLNDTIDLCARPVTLDKLIKATARTCGISVQQNHQETDEKKIEFYSDPKLFEKVYNFRPQYNLEDGLKSYLEWWRDG